MNGVMGIANAQRTLTYLRIFVEFVSQSEYRDVVGVYVPIISALHPKKAQTFFLNSIGIVNEILWATITPGDVQSFYLAAYQAIRASTYVPVLQFFLLFTN
jgi:glucan 1,3-beta-glucosidase